MENILISLIILIIVAIEHLFFGYVEMFGSKQMQSKAFGFEENTLNSSLLQTALSNQGIYNIGLGLLILFFVSTNASALILKGTLAFVILVGVYGAFTVTKKILVVQVLPAILGIIALTML